MHYYQFNIGDYAKATRHLSNLEDLVYRRLIELYYDTEEPLITDIKKLSRLINMRENEEEIRTVLDDFFVETEGGYSQSRIENEIASYKAKAESARVNGKKGGRPKKAKANPTETEGKAKKTQSVNLENQTETEGKAKKSESKANHKPITNNQYNNICQQIADAYNSQLSELGKVITLSDKRKSQIRGCIKEFKNTDYDFEKIETWSSLFSYIQESDFLMGRKENWSANFDFIIKKGNLLKIIEGAYEN